MQEQIVSFETAKLAEEKGFKHYTCLLDKWLRFNNIMVTQSLLQKWLRINHNCIVEVCFDKMNCLNKIDFFVTVDYYKPDWSYDKTINEPDYVSDYFDSYEEALEIGLQEGLKLIKKFNVR